MPVLPRSLLRAHTSRLAGVLGLSVLAALGEAVGLALFTVVLNHVLGAKDAPRAPGIIGGLGQGMSHSPGLFFALLALTYIGKSLLTLLANYASIAVALKIADGWRLRLLRAFLHLPLRHAPTKQGVTMQLVLDEPTVAGQGLAAGGILVQNVVSAATIYLTLLWLSPNTTLLLTCIALVSMLALAQVFRYSRVLGGQRSVAYTQAYGYLGEMMSALRQVKMFGLERRVEEQATTLVDRMRSVMRRSTALSSSPRVIIELVFVVVFAVVLAIMAPRMAQADLVTSAGLAAVAAMRLLPSFSAAAGVWVLVQQALPAMMRIEEQLGRLEAQAATAEREGLVLPPLQRSVSLQGVSFSYPERPPLFQGMDLQIEAGRFTALVGPSGSGKSTVLELLCGLHDPEQGRVLVDGAELRTASKAAWLQQIGVVPQDGFLMSGTVRENLVLLRPDCPEEVLLAAVRAVGADQIIRDLPAGYDTVIGERGVSLSGGQRQRLALARILVREPTMLLLDEATSALDAESDEAIFANLARYRGKMTIVAVAHRLASVRNADRIYFIASGRVVESGTHQELMLKNGPYAALYRASERFQPAPASAQG